LLRHFGDLAGLRKLSFNIISKFIRLSSSPSKAEMSSNNPGRLQKDELRRLTPPTERLIGASLQHDSLNPLEIFLRMTVLVRMSVDSVMTIKLRMKKLVCTGLELVKATSIP
jgi:hypothetical protein